MANALLACQIFVTPLINANYNPEGNCKFHNIINNQTTKQLRILRYTLWTSCMNRSKPNCHLILFARRLLLNVNLTWTWLLHIVTFSYTYGNLMKEMTQYDLGKISRCNNTRMLSFMFPDQWQAITDLILPLAEPINRMLAGTSDNPSRGPRWQHASFHTVFTRISRT